MDYYSLAELHGNSIELAEVPQVPWSDFMNRWSERAGNRAGPMISLRVRLYLTPLSTAECLSNSECLLQLLLQDTRWKVAEALSTGDYLEATPRSPVTEPTVNLMRFAKAIHSN